MRAIRAESGSFLLAGFVAASSLFFSAYRSAGQSLVGATSTKPATSAQQSPGPPSINVKVNLVSTPVVVTDAKGEPVLGLAENNFRVSDKVSVDRAGLKVRARLGYYPGAGAVP